MWKCSDTQRRSTRGPGFSQASDANRIRDKVCVKQNKSATQQKVMKAVTLHHQPLTYLQWDCCLRSFRGRHSGSFPSISPGSLQHPVTQTLCMSFTLIFWGLPLFLQLVQYIHTLSSARVQTSSASPLIGPFPQICLQLSIALKEKEAFIEHRFMLLSL